MQFDAILVRPGATVRRLAIADVAFAPHTHGAYTIATLLAGDLVGSVGGEPIHIGPGESALVGPGVTHEARAQSGELVSVAVDPILIDDLLTDLGWYRPDARPVFRGATVADPVLGGIAKSLADELGRTQPGQHLMVDALLRQLGVHVLRTHVQVRREPGIELSRAGPVDRRLRRAIELMHARPDAELSLKELADSVFLSEHYFAHLFKDVTGLTPHAYLANVRIERARRLLAQTELPVAQVAAEVGYRSASHFAHAFRSVTGASPRAYRDAAHSDPRPITGKERN